jgi:hypothetical protein
MNLVVKRLDASFEYLVSKIKAEYAKQGHKMTGTLERSMRFEIIKYSSVSYIGRVYMEDYGLVQNYGIRSSVIKKMYSTPGRSSKSAYIEGLIKFWKFRKGLNDKEALSAAIATAKKHRKFGMPLESSRRFSANRKRVGALRDAIKGNKKTFKGMLSNSFDQVIKAELIDNFKNKKIRKIRI